MNPLALIEKLINEHGSASITRDNLALLRDQIKIVEKENVKARERISDLEEQVGRLTADREHHAKQLADYQDGGKHRSKKDYRFDEAERRVLQQFAAARRNTLELNVNDPVVSALKKRGFLVCAGRLSLSTMTVPMQIADDAKPFLQNLDASD